jgi:hypothetical protein
MDEMSAPLQFALSFRCRPRSFHTPRRFSSFTFQLTGLGAIWTLTDIIHMGEEDEEQKVPAALSKLDT